jgi:hypothetical protein
MASKTFTAGTVIDSGWLNDVNSTVYEALQLADYVTLRAYSGSRKNVYVLRSGIAGTFVRDDSDTTSADNGGTVIVASNGKRWKRAYTGAVNVMWFGAVGTNVATNAAYDTPAFVAALATGKNVIIPPGYYFVSQTMNLGYAQCMWGAGRGKTYINYTGGAGTVGIYCGATGLINPIYDIELKDFTLFCNNMASRVDHGVMLENCVYFNLDSITVLGPGSPNDATPANRVLTGNGIYITNNSIIGRISRCSARLWNNGYYLRTLPSSPSAWAASIVIDGQGELANNMLGMVIGDPAVAYSCGSGVAVRDMCVQGNYSGGMLLNSGDSTIVEGCYFEGNANYDVTIGGGASIPACVRIHSNNMATEDIGVTPYGTFPYTAKVIVNSGSFATIRDNDMSISTAIPLIRIFAAADSTTVTGNRLNSTAAANARIANISASSIINDNFPNGVSKSASGSFTRVMNTADGTYAVTGLGFRPSALHFNCAIDTVAENSVGYVDALCQARCITSDGSNIKSSSNYAIKIIRPTAADALLAAVQSLDKDGFTLNFTHTGTPPGNSLVVNWLAIK